MKEVAEFLHELKDLDSGNIGTIEQFWLVAKAKRLLDTHENELIYLETKKNYKENGIYEDNETSSNDLR